jgi:2-oxoglutarate dehydrogenase E2 component (dihydrolipoamide succinyltransferase)
VEIKVPSVGESITEGTIAQWLKKNGAHVRQGEALFELETDKATTEVPAPAAGVLRIGVTEGKTVAIGAVVGTIEDGAAASQSRPPSPEPATSPKPDKRADKAEPAAVPAREPQPPVEAKPERPLSPAARRLAVEAQVQPGDIPGTGRHGLVTKEDVLQYLDQRRQSEPLVSAPLPVADVTPVTPPQSVVAARSETRQPMSAIRQRISERLLASQKNAATLTTFNEADMSAVMDLRARFKDRFREKHGAGLGFMGFFVKAVVEALRAYPIVNAWIDQTDIVYHDYYNIGVAVSTDRGLMVPVLRDADRLSFAAIEKTMAELAEKARAGKIGVQELQGGTFTITNGGIFGSMLSTPILNPPQSAILGMHAIQKRPVAVNDQVVIRPMMYLALSYDHRLIDGRDAVLFLIRIKECIEQPDRLLLEV